MKLVNQVINVGQFFKPTEFLHSSGEWRNVATDAGKNWLVDDQWCQFVISIVKLSDELTMVFYEEQGGSSENSTLYKASTNI